MERLLSAKEIIRSAREYHELELWKKVQQAALTFCGKYAYKVCVEIDMRDANADHPGTHSVSIYDKYYELIWFGGVFQISDFEYENYEDLDDQIPFNYEEEAQHGIVVQEKRWNDEEDFLFPANLVEDLRTDKNPYNKEDFLFPTNPVEDLWKRRNLHNELIAHLTRLDCEDDLDTLPKQGGSFEISASNNADPLAFTQFPPFDTLYGSKTQLTSSELVNYLKNGGASHTTYWLNKPPALSFPVVYLKEGETYQLRLNAEELGKIAQMYDVFSNWENIFKIIRTTYGEQASAAIIETNAPFNDEGYNTQLKEVHDKDGNILLPDPNLPIWQKEDIFKFYDDFYYLYAKREVHSIADLANMHKDYETNLHVPISQDRYREPIKNTYNRDWYELSQYVISGMLTSAEISLSMTYTLDTPPPKPLEVYTDQE